MATVSFIYRKCQYHHMATRVERSLMMQQELYPSRGLRIENVATELFYIVKLLHFFNGPTHIFYSVPSDCVDHTQSVPSVWWHAESDMV